MQPSCPLCSSTDTTTIYTLSASEAAQNWVIKQHQPAAHHALADHIRKLWGQETGSSVECRACRFNFAHPFKAGDAAFYEMAFGPSNYPKDKWEFRETVKALERSQVQGGRALEIGAGYGYFLDQISPRFFAPDQVTALEYNPVAKEKLGAKGYRVSSEDLNTFVERAERFSAVFMFQVLEHYDQPHETFSALSRLIEPNGHLFIAVPRLPSVRFWERHGAMMDVPPNHIGFWSEENLAAQGARYGFDVAQIGAEPFSFADFVKWDAYFSYLRLAQLGLEPVSRLYAKRREPLGRLMNMAAYFACAPRRIPVWLKSLRRKEELSLHTWVHLVRRP